jgi:hypothetical protein
LDALQAASVVNLSEGQRELQYAAAALTAPEESVGRSELTPLLHAGRLMLPPSGGG